MKIKIYISLLLAMLLTSCELYMDNYEEPAATEGPDPKEEVVTELDESGAKISYQYTDAVMELTEQHRQYILTNLGDSVFYYNQDTPQAFLPKPGDVLVCKNCEQFPTGFARKVTDVQKSNGMYAVQAIQASYDETFVEFDMDCTDVEYPTMYYNDETTPDGPVFVKPKSRGENKTEIDGVVFTKVSDFTFTLSAKTIYGIYEGQGTIQVVKYDAVLADKFSIWQGKIEKHQITLTDIILDGDFSAGFDVTDWSPFNAGAGILQVGAVSLVCRPKISMDFKGQITINGKVRYRMVTEDIVEAESFVISNDTDFNGVEGKYGSGWEVKASVSGTLKLKITLDFSLGVGFLGDFIEVGAYVKASFTFTWDSTIIDPNARSVIAPRPEPEPLTGFTPQNYIFLPRTNSNITTTFALESAGIYIRLGTDDEEAKSDYFDDIRKKFETYNVDLCHVSDIFELFPDNKVWAMYLRINILEVIKQRTGIQFTKPDVFPFFPELNSQDSRIICRNYNRPEDDRYWNDIYSIIAFKKRGIFDTSNLSLLIFDDNKNYIKTVKADDTDIILDFDENHKLYTINTTIEGIETATAYYYYVYPCYKVRSLDQYFVDREFKVKVKHPSATFYNTHQNYFNWERVGEDINHYYTVRSTIDIESTPEVQNWGVSLYISDKSIKIWEEDNLKDLVKIGSTMFESDPSGNNSYMNGRTSISLTLTSANLDLENLYLYLLPIYKSCEDKKIHKIYGSAEKILLKDDSTLVDKYAEEQWDFADQNLNF